MKVVKIKDRDNLVKNLETGAVINTDTLAYEKRINGTAGIGPLKIKRDVVVILVPKLPDPSKCQ